MASFVDDPLKLPRPGMPRVEAHGFTGGRVPQLSAPVDLTPFMTHLTWEDSLTAPWFMAQVTLSIPLGMLFRVLPGIPLGNGFRSLSTGWWLVIRHPHQGSRGQLRHGNGWPALGFGRVHRVAPRITIDKTGGFRVMVSILAYSWAAYLSRSRIALTDGGVLIDGAWYDFNTWSDDLIALMRGSAENQAPGPTLEAVWQLLVRMEVPDTLGGGEWRNEVPVVHDRQGAARYAPQRAKQHLRVNGRNLRALGNALPRQTLWSWLEASFKGPDKLVEFFPTLEFPSFVAMDDAQIAGEDGGAPVPLPPLAHPDDVWMTALGSALGAQPVLMYRLRPTLVYPVNAASADQVRASLGLPPGGAPIRAEEVAKTTGLTTTYGQEAVSEFLPAIDIIGWYNFGAGSIHEIAFTVDDEERVNAVHVKTPVQPTVQLELYDAFAMPSYDEEDIRRHGLRLLDVDWPFYSAEVDPETGDIPRSLKDELSAFNDVVDSMMASHGGAVEFGGAQVKTEYRPWIKPGHWSRLTLVEDLRAGSQGATTAGMAGYLERVRNTVVLTPGGFDAQTELTVTRATLEGADPRQIISLPELL